MLTPLDFDEYKIPVPLEWKKELASCIAKTATLRENSFDPANKHCRYTMTILQCSKRVCKKRAMANLVARCLSHCWNESLDYAKAYSEVV